MNYVLNNRECMKGLMIKLFMSFLLILFHNPIKNNVFLIAINDGTKKRKDS